MSTATPVPGPAQPTWPGPVVPFDVGGAVQVPTFRDAECQAALERDGFVRLRFLTDDVMARVIACSDELGPSPADPRTGHFVGNSGDAMAWKLAVTAALRPLVEAAAAEIFDDHHAYYVTFMTKWPGRDGYLPPHQDPTMVADEHLHRGVTLLCPLTPMRTVEEMALGVIRVVPGSHLLPTSEWMRARWHAGPAVAHLAAAIDAELSVAVPTELGEAIVYDHRTIHNSLVNTSSHPRTFLAVALRPAATTNVNLECDRDGWVRCYVVDDDYYLADPAEGSHDRTPLWTRPRSAPPTVDLDDLRVGRSAPPERSSWWQRRFAGRR